MTPASPAVDSTTLDALTQAVHRISTAITANAMPGHDAAGGTVDSLTEAVMGMTASLQAIAGALGEVATAIPSVATAITEWP